ncbi:MAG: UDP-N-acetylmuramate--L-alanine ligase [Zetaproteobacteria bacterium CG2_30_46_52]|nr:MAG: UDP-N-acetylmuramate--L-alanine ligase [Zetaproteobacteria bacterium CG2_30_46_52]
MKARVQCIHFTGIGGIGMSGIAEVLHNQGFVVQGSDVAESPNVQRLRDIGMKVIVGHAAENLGDAQVVVVTTAVKRDNPELIEATRCGIPIIPRAEMLAELMRMRQGIAIAGSHGKTTITSMIAHNMEKAGLDPTYVIGGRLMSTTHNARLGESKWLVAEADESDGSFLRLSPMISVVSNIDPEHLDHYGDFESLITAFKQFVSLTPFYGRVVLHHEHPNVALLRDDLHRPVTTYGSSPQADLYLKHVTVDGYKQHITIGFADGDEQNIMLPMPGLHNAENALAATAVLLDLGISMDLIRAGFATFEGIQRRFHCFAVGEAVMVDDYAHHPKEILSTLQAANSCWPERPVSALFQPHRYTRTQDLFDDFMGCFDGAQTVRILPIYAASEAPIEGVSATALVAGMRTRGHRDVDEVDSMQAAEAWVKAELVAGRVVLLMGAGSIGALATVLRKEMMTKAGQKS